MEIELETFRVFWRAIVAPKVTEPCKRLSTLKELLTVPVLVELVALR